MTPDLPHPGTTVSHRLALLPGMDGTGELFAPLLAVIPPGVATRVVRYPADEFLSYDALLERVEDQLREERDIVLVAESFSGPLALRYAVKHGRRVRAVVLCASFVQSPLPRWLRILVRPVLFRRPPSTFMVRRLMLGADAPDQLVRAVTEAIGRVAPSVLAARLREVFDLDCTRSLRQCPAPIMYLAPSNDALLRGAALAAVRANRPQVRVARLTGPHLLLQRRPLAAWKEIQQFLATVPRAD